MEKKIIVSACLTGCPCRYDGKAQLNEAAAALVASGKAVPVCPECMGGLPTPRVPAEIVGGTGEDVLAGKARVIANDGNTRVDVTEAFVRGAQKALETALSLGACEAVLKANSPSCGFGTIYDGSFSGAKKAGNGVTAALLAANGIAVKSL